VASIRSIIASFFLLGGPILRLVLGRVGIPSPYLTTAKTWQASERLRQPAC
jgi:hypothetical protein